MRRTTAAGLRFAMAVGGIGVKSQAEQGQYPRQTPAGWLKLRSWGGESLIGVFFDLGVTALSGEYLAFLKKIERQNSTCYPKLMMR
jgi:hypothetical protein